MSQQSVAAQAAQFWELLQRAQKLALSAQSTTFAKAAGQEFSVVDANSAGAAAMKAFAEFAQHPLELAAFQQNVWLDATKALGGRPGLARAPQWPTSGFATKPGRRTR